MGIVGDIYKGAKGLGGSLLRGRTAGARRVCTADVLTPEGETICVEDLSLDAETGDLVTPAEAERRARERGTAEAVMVWDSRAEEWLTVEEYNRRESHRAELRRSYQEHEGVQLGRGDEEPDVFDALANEWVSPLERQERSGERFALSNRVAGLARWARPLPSLASLSGAGLKINSDGVALIGDRSAGEVLSEEPDESLYDKIPTMLVPEEDDGELSAGSLLVFLAAMVAIIATIALRRGA